MKKRLLSIILSMAIVLGMFAALGLTASAIGTVDVTANVTMEDIGTAISADTTTILVKLGNHSCLPTNGSGFFSNDNPSTNGIDVLSYVEINGVSARSIVTDNQTGVTAFTGTAFPMNIGGIYSPVMEFCESGYFRFSILNDYAARGTFSVTLKSGFAWANNDGETLTVSEDVTYNYATGTFAKVESAKEIGLNAGSVVTSADYVQVGITVANGGNLPEIGYHFSEVKSAFPAVTSNLLVGGKSVAQINDEYDGSYTYTEFPATAGRAYQDPVYLFADNGVIWVKIAKPYFKTLPNDFEVTFGADFTYDLGGKTYVVPEAKTFFLEKTGDTAAAFYNGKEAFTIPTVGNTANAEGYQCFNMVFDHEMPAFGAIGYDGMTVAYDLLDKILVNGKSVAKINQTVSTAGYTFNYFPASVIDSFKMPIVVFVSANNIELKINNSYFNTIKDSFTVSILPNFSFGLDGTKYTMSKGFKYVDGAVKLDDMFNVGYQYRTNSAAHGVRFVSLLDSADYDAIYYTVAVGEDVYQVYLDCVYTGLIANGNLVNASDINPNAQYFSILEMGTAEGSLSGQVAVVSVYLVKDGQTYYTADRLIAIP
ncbi:MAG: hypothetical protein MJ132_02800 [Clostridia bacterium]|nr:hypothetical protein [Clostridia bacterium]